MQVGVPPVNGQLLQQVEAQLVAEVHQLARAEEVGADGVDIAALHHEQVLPQPVLRRIHAALGMERQVVHPAEFHRRAVERGAAVAHFKTAEADHLTEDLLRLAFQVHAEGQRIEIRHFGVPALHRASGHLQADGLLRLLQGDEVGHQARDAVGVGDLRGHGDDVIGGQRRAGIGQRHLAAQHAGGIILQQRRLQEGVADMHRLHRVQEGGAAEADKLQRVAGHVKLHRGMAAVETHRYRVRAGRGLVGDIHLDGSEAAPLLRYRLAVPVDAPGGVDALEAEQYALAGPRVGHRHPAADDGAVVGVQVLHRHPVPAGDGIRRLLRVIVEDLAGLLDRRPRRLRRAAGQLRFGPREGPVRYFPLAFQPHRLDARQFRYPAGGDQRRLAAVGQRHRLHGGQGELGRNGVVNTGHHRWHTSPAENCPMIHRGLCQGKPRQLPPVTPRRYPLFLCIFSKRGVIGLTPSRKGAKTRVK
ncbi:MAG: hypothetical protein BWY76_01159 [bacterium ADurb.Bin429]|nr:MAG: hypothetical protein BWY76_01159 [bacterium ADurb.Bin429]